MGTPRPERPSLADLRKASAGRQAGVRRALAWWYTGPLGHLVAGALDIGALLIRLLWLRARSRRIEWF
jgi:hypothetical protein